jgi:hypothetical protein
MGGGNENMIGEGNVGEDDKSRDNEAEEVGMTAGGQRRSRSGYGGCMMETMTRPTRRGHAHYSEGKKAQTTSRKARVASA